MSDSSPLETDSPGQSTPSCRTLDEIASDYERAEITTLWLHDEDLKTHTMLYAVVELCPSEQPASTTIFAEDKKTAKQVPTRRRRMNERQQLYAARLFLKGVAPGLAFYRGVGGVRRLELSTGAVDIRSIRDLSEEPPNEIPVLVAERGEDTYQHVLPRRPTDLRVCSRFGEGLAHLARLTPGEMDHYRAFSKEELGIDIVEYAEHLGAVHLCMANPILRSMSESLDRDDTNLLVEMYERQGKSAKGCRLRLADHRPGGIGFDFELEVTTPRLVVPLPCRPQELETRLYSPNRELLGYTRAAFISEFRMQMGVGHSRRRINTQSSDGSVKQELVQVMSWESRGAVAQDTRKTPIASLLSAIQQRNDRRDADGFFFFPGGPSSREEARALIRRLIGAARDRCMLCDPYLSAEDVLEYATFATTHRLPIRLLTSAHYLTKRDDDGDKGTRLQERVRQLVQKDSSLLIECRVLRGKKSPVHDRFLMLDDDVYLMGSSLAELGLRATAVYRSPHGAVPNLPGVLEGWWNDSRRTRTLDDWCSRKPEDAEE